MRTSTWLASTAGIAIAVALSGAASAADIQRKAAPRHTPSEYVAMNWTGMYIGASVGAVAHQSKMEGDGSYYYEYIDSMKSSGVGALGGFQAGYNHQMGQFVMGIEADYSIATGASGRSLGYDGYVGNLTELHGIGTVRGRVGIVFDRMMLYGTGGLAFGQVTSEACDSECDEYGFRDERVWRTGWTAGAGLEYAVTRNISIKAEGLYYDLGAKTRTTEDDYTYTDRLDGIIARIGVNYRF